MVRKSLSKFFKRWRTASWCSSAGLVYQSRLADQADPTNFVDLVLTSEDFGQAYMLDGWATRFVVEPFRNFTVLFVGYSLNDPVMRYMVDALAAARMRGEPFKRCYAFAAYEGESSSSMEAEWEAKGVCAIPYRKSPAHHHLYETLKELADLHEEGLTSKQSLALRYADSPPVDEHDPIGRRVTWALGAHLEHAADRAEEQWTRRVRPFIDKYWPQDNVHKSPAVSAAFSDLVLKTGDAFPCAVAATQKFLMANRDHDMFPYKLRRDHTHLVEAFPDSVLELLYLTTPQTASSHCGLQEVLDHMLIVRPKFKTDRRFQHLERIA